MSNQTLPPSLEGVSLYMVGIKGTGMAALAELLHFQGARITGSDGTEKFYTDTILTSLGIPYAEGFSVDNIPEDVELAVYSAAYDPATHPELAALEARGVPLMVYPEALGYLSRLSPSTAIAGVHGKTTTTAMTAALLQGLGWPVSVLVGSAVPGLGGAAQGRSTLVQGTRHFVAETCEYRRHFLHFSPTRMVLTSVEADHLDYFKDEADVEAAFLEFIARLPEGGELIYCADDPGAARTALKAGRQRPGLRLIPYGFTAPGEFRIHRRNSSSADRSLFSLGDDPREFSLAIPGEHSVLNAAAALAVISGLSRELALPLSPEQHDAAARALADFRGSRRRCEVLGEAGGILFMDDYGHHPTAIRKTLEGLKAFYPHRRLVVDFMSHTYSRTASLLDEFSQAFGAADALIFHKIYASAREKNPGTVTGRLLAEKTGAGVHYFDEPDQAVPFLETFLQPGDLFLTLGAGNNWVLGSRLYDYFQQEHLS